MKASIYVSHLPKSHAQPIKDFNKDSHWLLMQDASEPLKRTPNTEAGPLYLTELSIRISDKKPWPISASANTWINVKHNFINFILYNVIKPFLFHHSYTVRLPYLCLVVEMKILKEIMHFNMWLSCPCPRTRNPIGECVLSFKNLCPTPFFEQ